MTKAGRAACSCWLQRFVKMKLWPRANECRLNVRCFLIELKVESDQTRPLAVADQPRIFFSGVLHVAR